MPKIYPHAWQNLADSPGILNALREAKDLLRFAWENDQQNPNSYPIHTDSALIQIQEHVSGKFRKLPKRIPRPKRPTNLAELIPEKTVKGIWELHHNGSFGDAIREAAGGTHDHPFDGRRAFRGILWAIERAYGVGPWGYEPLPRPKVNILHLGLEQIAKAAGLGDQTEQGFAQFLDDICPCGLKRHREAVRKLRSRAQKIRRPRS